ncbi:MAG TPA: hypothetical protein VHD62_13730 [Opitutaceae bacterium]|nr:hypothetical protein [Opitutaceae bacterium]
MAEPLPLDPVQAKKVVAEAVPIGTTVDEAKKRMEQRGFSCRLMNLPGKKETYLSCYATGPGVIVVRQWGVTFEVIDGKVGEGRISTDLLGP